MSENQKALTTYNINEHGFYQFVIVLAGVLIIFLAIVIFALNKRQIKFNPQVKVSPTPNIDKTTSWKTYIDSEDQLSFKYPEYLKERKWPFSTFDEKLIVSLNTDDIELSTNGPLSGTVQKGIVFQVSEISSAISVSPQDFVRKRCELVPKYGCKQIDFNGYPAAIMPEQDNGDSTLFVEKGNQVFELHLDFAPDYKGKEHEKLFNQILSTFKFID